MEDFNNRKQKLKILYELRNDLKIQIESLNSRLHEVDKEIYKLLKSKYYG